MAVGLPEAVRVFNAFDGPDSDPGATPVMAGTDVVDVGTQSCWASVTFTGAATFTYTAGGYGAMGFYRVLTQWIDDANHTRILINANMVVVHKITAGVPELLGQHSTFPYSWGGGDPGTYYIEVSASRGQVIIAKAGQYQHIVVGPLYGEGYFPANGHYPAGTEVVVDSAAGSAVIDAYMGLVDQPGVSDGWLPYATEEDGGGVDAYILDHSYLPWVIDQGHLRDCFSGDYDQSFGGGGYLVDGQSTFGRLDVDLYGDRIKTGYCWFVLAGTMAGPGRAWSGVSALVVSPVGYSHMTQYGYAPGADASDVPTFADGDTFSAILTGEATTEYAYRHLQLLHNGVVYWETDLDINLEGFDDGTYVGVWAQNYGYQPRGYGGPSEEWGVSNFRWTSLPVIPRPVTLSFTTDHTTVLTNELVTTTIMASGLRENQSPLHTRPSIRLFSSFWIHSVTVTSGTAVDQGYDTDDHYDIVAGSGTMSLEVVWQFPLDGPASLAIDVAAFDSEAFAADTTDEEHSVVERLTFTIDYIPPPPPPPGPNGWSVGRVT